MKCNNKISVSLVSPVSQRVQKQHLDFRGLGQHLFQHPGKDFLKYFSSELLPPMCDSGDGETESPNSLCVNIQLRMALKKMYSLPFE